MRIAAFKMGWASASEIEQQLLALGAVRFPLDGERFVLGDEEYELLESQEEKYAEEGCGVKVAGKVLLKKQGVPLLCNEIRESSAGYLGFPTAKRAERFVLLKEDSLARKIFDKLQDERGYKIRR